MDTVRVLAVDDLEEHLESIRENLELRGFNVTIAMDANEVIKKLQSDLPHVVVLDFRLGGTSTGLEVLKEIRLHDKFIPVVLYSGMADGEDKAALVHEQITFILEKGARPDALPELLAQIVSGRNEIIAGLEQWIEGNASADEPAFALTTGAVLTMNEALAEMKKGTPLGRVLLQQYRQGLTEIFVAGGGAGRSTNRAEEGT